MVRDAYLRQVIENIVTHEANLSVAEYGKKCGGRMGGGMQMNMESFGIKMTMRRRTRK